MIENDRNDFSEIMKILSVNSGRNLDITDLEIWFKLLSRWSLQDIKRASFRHMEESKYMPTMHDFINHIEGTKENNAEIEASNQLDLIIKSISKYGAYQAVLFADPHTQSVLKDLGGWIAICRKTNDEMMWFRKDFLTSYQRHRINNMKCFEVSKSILGKTDDYKLIGVTSNENMKRILAIQNRNKSGGFVGDLCNEALNNTLMKRVK